MVPGTVHPIPVCAKIYPFSHKNICHNVRCELTSRVPAEITPATHMLRCVDTTLIKIKGWARLVLIRGRLQHVNMA